MCASSLKLNVQGSAWRQLMIVFKKTHKKRKETNWIWRAILLFFGGISRSHAQNWFQLTAGWCSVPKFWSSLSSARQNFPFWKMRGTIETGIVFCVVASSHLSSSSSSSCRLINQSDLAHSKGLAVIRRELIRGHTILWRRRRRRMFLINNNRNSSSTVDMRLIHRHLSAPSQLSAIFVFLPSALLYYESSGYPASI